MRLTGNIPAPPNSLREPRGFNDAPIASRNRLVVSSEAQLRQALRDLGGLEGGVIQLGASFVVSATLKVLSPVVVQGNRFKLLPGEDVSTLFEVRSDWCLFDGVQVGDNDALVPTLTAFDFTTESENCVMRDCVIRASTPYASTAVRLRIFECHQLTTSGGSWTDLNLP